MKKGTYKNYKDFDSRTNEPKTFSKVTHCKLVKIINGVDHTRTVSIENTQAIEDFKEYTRLLAACDHRWKSQWMIGPDGELALFVTKDNMKENFVGFVLIGE